MAETGRDPRAQAGQRWLQAMVETVLAEASIPLAASALHQPAVYWVTQPDARPTLSLWLAEEESPRQLPFPRALIEDCGAGARTRQSYARAYVLRSLRQMGLVSS
jgi:hypothetical protein